MILRYILFLSQRLSQRLTKWAITTLEAAFFTKNETAWCHLIIKKQLWRFKENGMSQRKFISNNYNFIMQDKYYIHVHTRHKSLRSCSKWKVKSCSQRVRYSRWWGSLTMVPAGNKAKRLSSVNHSAKTIHHHHDSRTTFTDNISMFH